MKEKTQNLLKKTIKVLERTENLTSYTKKAYNEGYNDGYDEAKKKYLVTFPCSICGKPIEIIHPETKEAVTKYMREQGWGHPACQEKKRKS